MKTRWYVDDVELTGGLVTDVEDRSGWFNISEADGENVVLPTRSGQKWMAKQIGQGSVVLSVWLAGANEIDLVRAWENIVRTAAPTHRMVTLRKVMPDGSVRTCKAELTGGIEPIPVGRMAMRATLQFNVPAGVWESVATYTYASPAGATLPITLALPDLMDSTGPMESLTLDIAGPVIDPVIRDMSPMDGGHWVKYKGTVPDQCSLRLDCRTWEVTAVGSWTAAEAKVTTSGRRFMTLYPQPASRAQPPTLRLEGTTVTTQPRLTVSARAAFRC